MMITPAKATVILDQIRESVSNEKDGTKRTFANSCSHSVEMMIPKSVSDMPSLTVF